jgi:hypothetical protein
MRIAVACHSGAALFTVVIASSCSGIDRRFEPANERPDSRKSAQAPARGVTAVEEVRRDDGIQ